MNDILTTPADPKALFHATNCFRKCIASWWASYTTVHPEARQLPFTLIGATSDVPRYVALELSQTASELWLADYGTMSEGDRDSVIQAILGGPPLLTAACLTSLLTTIGRDVMEQRGESDGQDGSGRDRSGRMTELYTVRAHFETRYLDAVLDRLVTLLDGPESQQLAVMPALSAVVTYPLVAGRSFAMYMAAIERNHPAPPAPATWGDILTPAIPHILSVYHQPSIRGDPVRAAAPLELIRDLAALQGLPTMHAALVPGIARLASAFFNGDEYFIVTAALPLSVFALGPAFFTLPSVSDVMHLIERATSLSLSETVAAFETFEMEGFINLLAVWKALALHIDTAPALAGHIMSVFTTFITQRVESAESDLLSFDFESELMADPDITETTLVGVGCLGRAVAAQALPFIVEKMRLVAAPAPAPAALEALGWLLGVAGRLLADPPASDSEVPIELITCPSDVMTTAVSETWRHCIAAMPMSPYLAGVAADTLARLAPVYGKDLPYPTPGPAGVEAYLKAAVELLPTLIGDDSQINVARLLQATAHAFRADLSHSTAWASARAWFDHGGLCTLHFDALPLAAEAFYAVTPPGPELLDELHHKRSMTGLGLAIGAARAGVDLTQAVGLILDCISRDSLDKAGMAGRTIVEIVSGLKMADDAAVAAVIELCRRATAVFRQCLPFRNMIDLDLGADLARAVLDAVGLTVLLDVPTDAWPEVIVFVDAVEGAFGDIPSVMSRVGAARGTIAAG